MKKIRIFTLVLAMVLALQAAFLPGFATQETTTEAPGQANQPISGPQGNTFNGTDASITSGCRTINGQMPLYGSNRVLSSSQAALLYEVNTGTLLYAYNPDMAVAPSSLAKIMTLLVALEQGNLSDKVVVKQETIDTIPSDAVTAHLLPGQEVTVEQLLYALMVASANDACAVVAEHIAGSQDAFVSMMNKRAEQIGCTNTVFTNVHGLHHDRQVTTARDMVKIVLEATKNEKFVEIFAAPIYDMPATNKSEATRWYSRNYMLSKFIVESFYDPNVTGGRTGTTNDNGYHLINTAELGECQFVAVVLGAERPTRPNSTKVRRYGDFVEMQELLKMGYENQQVCQLLYEGQIADAYQVVNGDCQVSVTPDLSMRTMLPAKATADNITWQTQTLNGTLQAPISKGDPISIVQLWYGNVCLAQTQMRAANSVAVELPQDNANNGFFDSNGLINALVILGIVVLAVLAFFGIMYIIRTVRTAARRSRSKKRRQSRRRSR